MAPEPPHTEHGASAVMLTDVVMPLTASRKSRWSSVSRSWPCWGPTGAAAAPAAPATPAEEVAEDVAESAGVAEVLEPDVLEALPTGETATARPEPTGPERTRAGARSDHLADLVVLLALLGVAEHVVGRGDLLEALLGLLVAGVGVGVELLGQLPVGARDLLLGRALRHAEDGVVVLLEPLALGSQGIVTLRAVTRTMDGRRTRPLRR